ncbi:MAG: hypothetical protein GXX85_03280 [Ignavibacteria bacterium]|nr:hypothetical protein [Ignavibacteria bacterium]
MKADFGEIIFVAIFLLFSIISSLFNEWKKKKERQNQSSRIPENKTSDEKQPEGINDVFDIFFGKKNEPENSGEYYSEETQTEDNTFRDKELLRKSLEKQKNEYALEQTKNRLIQEKLKFAAESNAAYKVNSLSAKGENIYKENSNTSFIRKSLKEKESLKNYFLISEIIGKPKSLRR